MRPNKIPLIVSAALLIVACHTSKKTTTSSAETKPVAVNTPTTTVPTVTVPALPTAAGPYMPAKSADGIYFPGDEELAAIQPKFSDLTLEKLREGYTLYTGKACTSCHGTVNIYQIPDWNWMNIINQMAYKAQITSEQKDAVYKYVLAIKAAKSK